MAERLPRYRPLGVSIPGVPSVNYAQTGRAQAQVFGTLAASLDRMSEFVYERKKTEALAEGAEYGAMNAPTKQQLEQAGQDAEKVLPGDKTTVFGRAARKAALDTAQANMEAATRKEITRLRLDGIKNNVSVTEFTTQVQSTIDGYAEALDQVSPVAGVNFRAGMAANANSSVLAYSEKLLSEQQRQAKIKAELDADAIITGPPDAEPGNSSIDDVFAAGSTPATSTQQGVSITAKLSDLRRQVELAAGGGGDAAMVRSKLKAFDDAVTARYTQTISDWAMETPQALVELSKNKITNARVQDIWNNMDADQKRAAEDDIIRRGQAQLSFEATIDAKKERARKNLAETTVVEIAKARLKGDEVAVSNGLDKLALYDGDKYASLSETIMQKGNFDDPATINMLEIASLNNTLSQVMIMNAYSTGKLSNPTFVAMLEKVNAQRSEDHTEAMKYVRAMLVPEVLPGTILSGADDSHKKAAKKVAEIEAALILEVRRNPGVNRLEFIKPLVTARLTVDERDNTEAKNKANQIMEDLRRDKILADGFTVQDAINYYTTKGQKKMAKNLKVLQQ